ncbi:SPRY domain-containing protein [Clostridium botulinum]|uniref:SPRY domain-containing protein n=1 Tax=Clostridium botulinum TaxID=1491 RepID=UPI0004D95A99|nr:SPRY domain-containing protein [Clostridium botulinum]KEH90503.1 SPRY domain protein [Clostridium botulinum C/D str. It1]
MNIHLGENKYLDIKSKYIVSSVHPNACYKGVRTLSTYSTGKYYYEVTLKNINNIMILGVCTEKQYLECIERYSDFTSLLGIDTIGEYIEKGSYYGSCIPSINDNDTIGIGLDFDREQINFYINGKIVLTKDNVLSNSKTWYPCFFLTTPNQEMYINLGQKQFAYHLPNDFKPFCISCKYLLKQNDKYYSIKSEFYEDGKYKDLKIDTITDTVFENNGFNYLGQLVKEVTSITTKSYGEPLDNGRIFSFLLNNSLREIGCFEKSIELFCLLQYENNLYTFDDTTIEKIQNSITKNNFVNNGFKNYKALSIDLLLNKFKDLNKVKLLTWANDIKMTELSLNSDIVPFKPIDKFSGKIELIRQTEK